MRQATTGSTLLPLIGAPLCLDCELVNRQGEEWAFLGTEVAEQMGLPNPIIRYSWGPAIRSFPWMSYLPLSIVIPVVQMILDESVKGAGSP